MELVPEPLIRNDLFRRILPRQHQDELDQPNQSRRRTRVTEMPEDRHEVRPEDVKLFFLQQARIDRTETEVGVYKVEQPRFDVGDMVAENDISCFLLALSFIEGDDFVHVIALEDAVYNDISRTLHHDHEFNDLLLGASVPQFQQAAHELFGVNLEQGLHHRQNLWLDDVLCFGQRSLEHLGELSELGEGVGSSSGSIKLLRHEAELPAIDVEFQDRGEG